MPPKKKPAKKKPAPKKPQPKDRKGRARGGAGDRADNLLPGVFGKDYRLVRYGGKFYVVYQVKLPNGGRTSLSWRVTDDDMKAFGLNANKARNITKAEFGALNFFGNASEIQRRGEDKHPFDKFLKNLKEVYGNVSWLEDSDYMSVLLMGHIEGWSEAELTERLRRTKWFQNRTEAERAWEFDMSKAERNVSLKTLRQDVADMLQGLYGTVKWQDHVAKENVEQWILNVASGKWGDPSEGFAFLEGRLRNQAERIEGTTAWIELQQTLQDDAAFLNAPEERFEEVRAEALRWLGPHGRPDQATLWQWAKDLVAGTRSDADFQGFLRNQAKALYPYLGTDETWQDRASTYKRIVEEDWGTAIGWEHSILTDIGMRDENGNFTGAALSFDDFRKKARERPEFWQGSVAREEGFSLLAYLNDVFQGVG
jgi:hypothetical protein